MSHLSIVPVVFPIADHEAEALRLARELQRLLARQMHTYSMPNMGRDLDAVSPINIFYVVGIARTKIADLVHHLEMHAHEHASV